MTCPYYYLELSGETNTPWSVKNNVMETVNSTKHSSKDSKPLRGSIAVSISEFGAMRDRDVPSTDKTEKVLICGCKTTQTQNKSYSAN